MTKLNTTLLKDLPIKQTSITDEDYVVVSSGGTKKLKVKDITKDVEKKAADLEVKTKELGSQLEHMAKQSDLNNTNIIVNQIANNQIPSEYLEKSVDNYIANNNSGLATKENLKDLKITYNTQFLSLAKELNKYYWLNTSENTIGVAESSDYKIYNQLSLKAGTYYFKSLAYDFTFIKKNDGIVYKLRDIKNTNSESFTTDYDFDLYPTSGINDTAMLSNGVLPSEYVYNSYNLKYNGVDIQDIKNTLNNITSNVITNNNSLKDLNTFKENSCITFKIQYLSENNKTSGKYYWINGSEPQIADNEDYAIYNQVTLKAGKYYINDVLSNLSYIISLDKTSHKIISQDDVNNSFITVDYDFILCVTSRINTKAMVCNVEIPTLYFEGLIPLYNDVDIKLLKETLDPIINSSVNRVYTCGTGEQFTKLKDVIEEATKYKNSYVYVKPETFDLVQEFGQDYLDNYDGREFGIHLYNDIHVIFDSGAKVVFDYQGENKKVHEFFAPFNAKYDGGGFEIVNAWVESKNCRYSVHDEHAGDDVPYRNVYKHCTFIHDSSNCSWGSHQAIGGGLGKHGDIIVEDCYGKSVGTNQVFSWHNAVKTESCKSNIVVKGCYLEGYMDFGLQGTYTDATNIFVSNCSLTKKPCVVGDSNSVVNMKVYEWNNEIRTI